MSLKECIAFSSIHEQIIHCMKNNQASVQIDTGILESTSFLKENMALAINYFVAALIGTEGPYILRNKLCQYKEQSIQSHVDYFYEK